jgi:gamma-glutamylcyclotransferase (GGCT)/AIG2-like uncharacterized protein YtfP
MKDKIFYFAYGSNTNEQQMFNRLGYVTSIGNGTVDGYKISFDENVNGGVFANIIKNDNYKLHGHVYMLTLEQLYILDCFEGVPNVYERIDLNVNIFGESIKSISYMMNKPKSINKKPSKKYLNKIHAGYSYHDLPFKQLGDVKHEGICIRYIKKWL